VTSCESASHELREGLRFGGAPLISTVLGGLAGTAVKHADRVIHRESWDPFHTDYLCAV
jgi:hypothetical protein